MKKNILIFTTLLIPAIIFSQDEKAEKIKPIRIAVSNFEDTATKASEKEECGKKVSSLIEKDFTDYNYFQIRPSGAIKKYLDNLTKIQIGIIPPDRMKGDPSLLKIDYLTVGTVSKIQGRYEIDARTVNINNMAIVYSHGTTSGSMKSAVNDICWSFKEKFNQQYLSERKSTIIDRPTITVYKFRELGKKIDYEEYGDAFAEILNSQLGSFYTIATIERKYTKLLINEKMLEMAGVIENDESSEQFSNKGIQYKVEGDLRHFKDIICLNYRIIDTSNNSIVFLGSKDITTIRSIRSAGWVLSNSIEDLLNNRIGSLKVSSEPSEAKIYFDGKYEGKTPATLTVNNGSHEIKVIMDGYLPYKEELKIFPKKITERIITMKNVPMDLMSKAMEYEKNKEWEKAVKTYDIFIKKYIKTKEANTALYRKGHVEILHLKQYQNAKNSFQQLIDKYPDATTRSEGYFGLLKVYNKLNKKDKAIKIKKYILDYYGETSAAEEVQNYKL